MKILKATLGVISVAYVIAVAAWVAAEAVHAQAPRHITLVRVARTGIAVEATANSLEQAGFEVFAIATDPDDASFTNIWVRGPASPATCTTPAPYPGATCYQGPGGVWGWR